ncbi:hypothetical protein [Formosa sp. S-31]|uniref:hypothetical protein n=1 Tax=Formosa sp. S-31 TaxID=2790949 RepID=UPI003EBED2AA
MKKLALLLTLLFCFSCSTSDDNDTETSQSFNPPEWIQGEWELPETDLTGLKFTNDNFCTIINGTEACFKSVVDASEGVITVNESISTTEYKVTIDYVTEEKTFHYKKKSDTEIAMMILNLETAIYVKK